MKNKLVIFDCFGVICGEIAPLIFSEYFKDPREARRLKEEFCHPADIGLISEEQFLENVANRIGIDKKALREEWNSKIRLNGEIVPIIKKLGESADIALLSNAMEGLAERCIEKFGLAPLFDKIFLSYKYGVAKPNPDYYRLCLDSFGKDYDEVYMIDDSKKNLEPLAELGIKPILFSSVESIKENKDLKKLLI